jgi:hypothetical protein
VESLGIRFQSQKRREGVVQRMNRWLNVKLKSIIKQLLPLSEGKIPKTRVRRRCVT